MGNTTIDVREIEWCGRAKNISFRKPFFSPKVMRARLASSTVNVCLMSQFVCLTTGRLAFFNYTPGGIPKNAKVFLFGGKKTLLRI